MNFALRESVPNGMTPKIRVKWNFGFRNKRVYSKGNEIKNEMNVWDFAYTLHIPKGIRKKNEVK